MGIYIGYARVSLISIYSFFQPGPAGPVRTRIDSSK
jgi:hypothetical protein